MTEGGGLARGPHSVIYIVRFGKHVAVTIRLVQGLVYVCGVIRFVSAHVSKCERVAAYPSVAPLTGVDIAVGIRHRDDAHRRAAPPRALHHHAVVVQQLPLCGADLEKTNKRD